MNKRIVIILALVCVGAAVTYFLTTELTDSKFVHGTTAAQRGEPTKQAEELSKIERDYAFPQKTEFVEKMRKELADIQGELTRYSAQITRGDGPVKVDEQEALNTAQEKWSVTQKRLDLAERATESNWFELNQDFKTSYTALKASVQETRRKTNDKNVS